MTHSSLDSQRVHSIDAVRGVVMALMVLDHVRDYLMSHTLNPTDIETTTLPLFLTRWITHFCAPAFVFLAGTSAFLQQQRRGWSNRELSRHLLFRGLWLMALDVFVVRVLWWFNFDYRMILLGVLWAIGASMVALAATVFLGRRALLLAGLLMVCCHNLTDGVDVSGSSLLNGVWSLLHVQTLLQPVPGWLVIVGYPLIPWIGVLMLGYVSGPFIGANSPRRSRTLWTIGFVLIAAFLMLRWSNLYGDPEPWLRTETTVMSVVSFLNCAKYPPSLLYLLMTLGPMFIGLAVLESESLWLAPFRTIGRVPLFFYLTHLPLAHLAGVLLCLSRYGRADWWFRNPPFKDIPSDYGWSIPVWYAVALTIVVVLVPVCAWFGRRKARAGPTS